MSVPLTCHGNFNFQSNHNAMTGLARVCCSQFQVDRAIIVDSRRESRAVESHHTPMEITSHHDMQKLEDDVA